MKPQGLLYHLLLRTILLSSLTTCVSAITSTTKDKDLQNVNAIQSDSGKEARKNSKDKLDARDVKGEATAGSHLSPAKHRIGAIHRFGNGFGIGLGTSYHVHPHRPNPGVAIPPSGGVGSGYGGSGFGPGGGVHLSGNGYSYGAPGGAFPAEPPPFAPSDGHRGGGSFPGSYEGGYATGHGAYGGDGGLIYAGHTGGHGHGGIAPPPPQVPSGHGHDHGGILPPPLPSGHGGLSPHHKLALKSILIPLAGVAVLGAAAALASANPILLQLGVAGKRRRRALRHRDRRGYPRNPFVVPSNNRL